MEKAHMLNYELERTKSEFKQKGSIETEEERKNGEVNASLFSRAGVRVKRQEMGNGDRGTEVALGLLKVKKRRRKQA